MPYFNLESWIFLVYRVDQGRHPYNLARGLTPDLSVSVIAPAIYFSTLT